MLTECGTSLKASSPDVNAIAADLHSVAIRLLRQARQEDHASGLTAARLSALSVLVFGGQMTLGELARIEQVSLPTMTRIAAALNRAGYVNARAIPKTAATSISRQHRAAYDYWTKGDVAVLTA